MLTEVFRLTKAFVVVKFDSDGQASLVTLPAGAEVGLLGSSVVPGCVQIVYNDGSFNIFEEDLRGYSTSRCAALALVVSNRNLRRTGRHLKAV